MKKSRRIKKGSICYLSEVANWIANIEKGNRKYFWDFAMYYFDEIYWGLSPFMRFCVDKRIEGYKPFQIAEMAGKPPKSVKNALYKAKRRFMKAALRFMKGKNIV